MENADISNEDQNNLDPCNGDSDTPNNADTSINEEADSATDNSPSWIWTVEQLTSYAKGQLDKSILHVQKSAVALFWAGSALRIIREKKKAEDHGAWKKWKVDNRLKDTTVNDAIRLYEKAKTVEALKDKGVTEAKIQFVYPEKTKTSQVPQTPVVQCSTSPTASVIRSDSKSDESDQETVETTDITADGKPDVETEGATDSTTEEEEELEEPNQIPPTTGAEPFKVGDVIYRIEDDVKAITRFTVNKMTETDYVTKRRRKFLRLFDFSSRRYFSSREDAEAAWRKRVSREIDELNKALQEGPAITDC